ncbi:MAG: 16S rRNA (cytosine(1402)-N(4))-methyltransferase RsmH, partial [Verrucomicrobiota bacterium]|nr:16S rRNA (cytosine(1402)-N(4))-methyltransferase RsmH [Verrucomicrobiota bacterium]
MTDFIHEPVLLEEVLGALSPVSGGLYVDGTVGGGGHSEAILEACSPEGRLVAFDRDDWALEAVAKRLARFGNRLELHREAFAGLAERLVKRPCDGVLLDLGVSSPQLDEAERGFSFQSDGPLDMRMDRRQPLKAEHLVNELEPEELAEIFWKLGGERKSRRIARAIVEQRSKQRLETTFQLAEVVERACPRRGARTHPATGVFQALRMAVNDELGQVKRGLQAGWSVLKSGGRMAVITFHSGEDRAVKQFSRDLARPYTVRGEVDLPELR